MSSTEAELRQACQIKCTACIALASLLAVVRPATGIDIILNFDNGQSVNPTQDAGATGLQALFAHAESYYEDVFEDTETNTTLTVNFWYEDLDTIASPGTIGFHVLVDQNDNGGQPWREVEANIRLDNDRTWFIDPTPQDNSEFDMSQTLWRDLTPAQQNDYYNDFTAADIPETFEVGVRGAAPAGGVAEADWDMLSTVMHEVGHALGMSSAATATVSETTDLDYDFNPDFLFGETLASEVLGSVSHLDDDFAVMCTSCAQQGLRRMPSHTDLFTMAASNKYTNLDVPRREFYGGTEWNTPGNWSGNAVPNAGNDVFVRNPGSVVTASLSANGSADNLTVSEGASVDTGAFALVVGNTVLVTDPSTRIFVRSGGELEAATLQIENQGEVHPESGGLIDVDTLNINNTGSLIGAGTVDAATSLSNDGTISASGGTLVLNTPGTLDLDGSTNTGTINALAGNIHISNSAGTAMFAGTLNVGTGQSFTMDLGGLSSTGQINLTGGSFTAPILNHFGTLNISTLHATINADTRFENGSSTTLNADLTMLGDLLINPTATINGTATLIVSPGTTLNALDGVQIGAQLNNNGEVVLGPSAGTLTTDVYVQAAGGKIDFKLEGLTQGGTYDWLEVGGNATLGGLLDIALLGGFMPGLGNSFDIITAGSGISGVFSSVLFPVIPNIGLGISYSANTATLTTGLIGDLDNDGFVGLTDLNVVLSNWNGNVAAGVWIFGDPSGDGFIGIEDLNVLLGNWNAGTLPPAVALALIPEPGAVLMMIAGLGSQVTRRRRG